MGNQRPKTLSEHIEQEIFVSRKIKCPIPVEETDFKWLEKVYLKNKDSDNYQLIFNFFYGDEASRELGFSEFGVKGWMPGFDYCKIAAFKGAGKG